MRDTKPLVLIVLPILMLPVTYAQRQAAATFPACLGVCVCVCKIYLCGQMPQCRQEPIDGKEAAFQPPANQSHLFTAVSLAGDEGNSCLGC